MTLKAESCASLLALAALVPSVLLADGPAVSDQPLVLRQGGTPEKPAVYDGKGVVIDLGIDVTAHAW